MLWPRRRAAVGKEQLALRRPFGEEDVQPLPLPRGLEGRALEWRRLGAVDRIAVHAHPLVEAAESIDALGGNRASARRSDVEQEVPALRRGLHEHRHQLGERLEVLVRLVVAPILIHGDAALPIHARKTAIGDLLLWRSEIAERGLGELGLEPIGRLLGDAAVDQCVGRELVAMIEQRGAEFLRPGALPFAVEPHHPHLAVLGE